MQELSGALQHVSQEPTMNFGFASALGFSRQFTHQIVVKSAQVDDIPIAIQTAPSPREDVPYAADKFCCC